MDEKENNKQEFQKEAKKETETPDVHPASGMASVMRDFHDIEFDDLHSKDNGKNNEVSKQLTDLGVNEKHREVLEEKYKSGTSLTDDDLKIIENYPDETQEEIKKIFDLTSLDTDDSGDADNLQDEKPKDDFGKKLEEMDKESLIEEIKKNQRLVSERNEKLKQYESQFEELKKQPSSEDDSEAIQDLKALASDFRGTYDKIKDKYNLPDLDIVSAQINKGDAVSRLKQYQENDLRRHIEQKHGLAEGEFEYDANEAGKAGTPSYDWDYHSQKKLQEFESEQQKLSKHEEERTQKLEEQNKQDIKWIADTYYSGDEKKVNELLGQMSETVNKVSSGEAPMEKHPYSLRNLVRGFIAEELAEERAKQIAQDIISRFADEGMYLPSDKLPTDITTVPSKTKDSKQKLFDESTAKISPMIRSMQDVFE